MSKTAKLVTFEFTVRVVVDSDDNPEREEENAIAKAMAKVNDTIGNDLCFDHCSKVADDTECPYGTFEDEREQP